MNFFVWTTALGKIQTLDNLRKGKVIVVGWCYMCKRSGESIDYLLLRCEVTREVWYVKFRLFEVKWIMPRRVIELDCWEVVQFHLFGGCPLCA
jgi:hypothetical protein